jgi:hypothetical protein
MALLYHLIFNFQKRQNRFRLDLLLMGITRSQANLILAYLSHTYCPLQEAQNKLYQAPPNCLIV